MKPANNTIDNFFGYLKYDLPASIAVFLVAIPLSLGIALASGAPLFAGLLTGIIGGLVVAPLGASMYGVSGTTAGLAVIALTDVRTLGFEGFLLAVVIAGLIQIFLGVIKAGAIKYYFPSSVVNGMLAGIGIIIILKQIPHAVGYDFDYEGNLSFFQDDDYSSITELGHMLTAFSPTAIMISISSLLVLLIWERYVQAKSIISQWFQGPLLAITTGILINTLLLKFYPDFALKSEHLVNLPPLNTRSDLLAQIHNPDLMQAFNPAVYLAAFTLAMVASLETLLSIDAVDKLDPNSRITPSNRELIAQGVGNICCGLLGGLPLTQVIVPSSINIRSGAKSKAAAFTQGWLILLTIAFIPGFLNAIPLASLAAVLCIAGYRLAKPQLFQQMYQTDNYHFLPFCFTIIGLVFSNMLVGIAVGFGAAVFAILLEHYKRPFYYTKTNVGNKTIIRLSEYVSFLNKANIQRLLEKLPKATEVVIDATRSNYIDYDVYQIIENFKRVAKRKKIILTVENLRGFGVLPPVARTRAQTRDTQQTLTPAQVLTLLKEGNKRFVNNLEAHRDLLEQVNDTRENQFPLAIILSCIDSRTSVELIFDLGLGDVFSARVAGNIINDDILGSMEFACKVSGARLIVVLGHTHCGAIKGAYADVQIDHLTGLLAKIKPAVALVKENLPDNAALSKDEIIQRIAVKNVKCAVAQITEKSNILREMLEQGEIDIVGGMHDIETGQVQFYQYS